VAQRTQILTFLDTLLEPGRFSDYGPNGLQVSGADEVTRVATAVSATRAVIEQAVAAGAEFLLVHHGLFWDFHPTGIRGVLEERLRPLFVNNVSLAGYHLPLDAHPEVGNNALLANALGCERHEPFAEHRGEPIGRAGFFPGDGVALEELVERVASVTGRAPLVQGSGGSRIRGVGIVSGSGADHVSDAAGRGLDALLTGETREHVMADAVELGVHVLAAGHYATETFGVRALGGLLADRLGVEHVWIHAPNPV
jgi:dinuclear metal center YbgI/SA1388 family protein